MPPILRLYEDTITGGSPSVLLPPLPRMMFVVHGTMAVEGRSFKDGEVWHGEAEAEVAAGRDGVTLWRYELAPGNSDGGAAQGPGVRSLAKLSASLSTLPQGELLMRGDSVAFPPGGCAYLHRHQGPGIRCLVEGGIRIDTHDASTSYGPGCAWYESGPDPVFAQAAADRPSRFVRFMVLPRALVGKSSIELLNEADKGKPRDQKYQVFVDAPIELPVS